MDDWIRKQGKGNGVLAKPYKVRRSKLHRILSMVLVALMIFVQPLESLAATSMQWIVLYDSIRRPDAENDPEHELNGLYCYSKDYYLEVGTTIPVPEDPVMEGYHFLGWYTSKQSLVWNYPNENNKYDFETPIPEDRPVGLYAWWQNVRTDDNTITLTDGYSETVTLKKMANYTGINDYRVWYKFTPEMTGEYQFTYRNTTSGSTITAVENRYCGEDYLDYSSDVFTSKKPSHTINLEAGKTYYWAIYLVSTSSVSEFATTISFQSNGIEVPKKDIAALTITPDQIPDQVYTGSDIKPAVTVKDGDKTLTAGVDYKLVYNNNRYVTKDGEWASVTVKAVDGSAYTGECTKNFKITKKNISMLTITPEQIPDQVYTGSDIKPAITVKNGSQLLTAGVEYQLVYSNNCYVTADGETASVTIRAVDGSAYTGECTKYFKITKAQQPSNVPKSDIEAAYNVKTVGDVPLPDNWSWQEADRTKTLVSGKAVTAMAEYTGSDKTNYINTTVSVNITRKAVEITDFTLNVSETETKELKVGEDFKLEISGITPADAEEFLVSWQSSNQNVATVDEDGNVKAVSSGTAVVTAKIDKISRTCTVKVTNPVKDFSLSAAELSLKGGASERLSVTTTPVNPDAYTVMWSSSDTGVAMVDNTGLITAAGSGTAVITATIKDISKTCTVTVKNPLTAFTLNKETVALTAGNWEAIHIASKTPAKPDAYTVEWSSSDTEVADVSGETDTAKIMAKKAGTAIISVKIHNGEAEIVENCQVTVTAPTSESLTGIQITPENMDLKAGDKGVITVMPIPSGAVIGDIEYSLSNNEGIVEVNTNTGIVTAKKTGTVEIAVKAGGFEKTCTIKVSNPVNSFTLDKSSMKMQIGDNESLSVVSVEPADADSYTVQWQSDNPDVASVENGMVQAKAAGTAVITAVINGISRSCNIMVEGTESVPVSKIVLDAAEKNIVKGETFQIKVTAIEPETADNKEIVWVSSDTEIATVDEEGNVTGVAAGQAKIMALAKDESGTFAVCTVTVTNPVINFELNKSEMTMRVGEKERLLIVSASDSYTVQWKSNNPDVATVDESGMVEARVAGTAEITAVIEGISRSCTIMVENSEPLPVSKIVLDASEKTIMKGEKFQIKVTAIEPDTADNKEVSWVSSNPLAATVDDNGNVIGVAAGQAVIKAVAKDGNGAFAACTVTVKETVPGTGPVTGPETGDVKVSSLKITGVTKKVAPGKKIALTANVYPENAVNKQVVWKVSNSKYASVNSKGVVTAKKAGKGKKITVTAVSAENNSVKATYKITIMKKAVKKIKLTGKKTLKVGKTMKIKVKFTPSKGISKELTWTSSNKKIAVVDSKGKVTAKAKGRVKITAKAKDGSGKKASIKIQIK